MAPLKFCANISWLFAELPELTQRMRDAARAGFRAVEAAWIYSSDLKELKTVKDETGLEFALINTPPGKTASEFRQSSCNYDLTIQIHLMAGRVPAGADRCAVAMEMEDTFVQNLKHAAGVLSKEGILGLIEPINTRITDPRYFLDSPHQAAVILQRVAHPSIRMQMVSENIHALQSKICPLTHGFTAVTGHIQIAQVPDRHEPDSDGELSYTYLFKLLEELDYQDYIGCEYKPQRSTEAGLDWLRRYWSSHN
uniref:Putative hydroxypyruvate isomerase n=1 Tax=Sinocyclocheilus grahami TaxID=75366 RepID=A0A672N3B5_SINGR